MLVNSDGTMAAMQIVNAQKIRNVTPWDTNGEYRSVSCLQTRSSSRRGAPSTARPVFPRGVRSGR
jgi:hypothetical protein